MHKKRLQTTKKREQETYASFLCQKLTQNSCKFVYETVTQQTWQTIMMIEKTPAENTAKRSNFLF